MNRFAPFLLVMLSCWSAVASATPAEDLRQLFADERAAYYRDEPLAATSEGVHDYDDRLPSVTPESQARRLNADRQWLKRLEAIDLVGLSAQDRVSAGLFKFMVEQRVLLGQHRDWRMPMTTDSGFHADLLLLHEAMPFRTIADYERYLQRLADLPRYFAEQVANLRTGVREGFSIPAEILPNLAKVIAAEQYAKPEDCPLYSPFANLPSTMSAAEQERLRAAGREAIATNVLPTYAAFQRFFDGEYVPGARKTLGASAMPMSSAAFNAFIKSETDTIAKLVQTAGIKAN